MDALSSASCVFRGRPSPAAAAHSSSFLGRSIHLKKECNFRIRSHNICVAALSSGIFGVGVTESLAQLAQLQLELAHHMAALGIPLADDAGESSIWWATPAAPLVWWYLSAAPGSLGGLLDYASTPLHSHSNEFFGAEAVEVGRQIGQGSFGVVYEGYIRKGNRMGSPTKEVPVILKKMKPGIRGAAEMHATEEYMNLRVQRTAPNACAEYLGTTLVSRSQAHGRLTEGLWLIWKFEGGRTLDYYLKQRNFPENVAEHILGSKKPKEQTFTKAERLAQSNAVIRRIMFQILSNLRDLHRTGLVHRDVKPLNLILAEDQATFKLIDLGACVDIRSGYNYVPDETVIDPTYAAPEHHIMPTSTPELPPDPLCSLISPLVWALNTPDRFDLYSAGLILLQMAVKPLREDINLRSFNTEFKRVGYSLDEWRKRCRYNDEDFELLDVDGDAGWDLVKAMLQPRHDKERAIWPSIGSSRPSAEAALKHRFISGSLIKLPSFKGLRALPSHESSDLNSKKASGSTKPLRVPALRNPSSKEVGGSRKPVIVPSVYYDDVVNRLKSVQVPEFDSSQIVPALGALMQPALAAGLTWLVFSGLRSSAQATYALGQSLTQSFGITGTAFFAFFLIIKPWLEVRTEQNKKADGFVSQNASTDYTSLNQKATMQEARAGTSLSTRRHHSRVHRPSQTGLTEAVIEMELQLASLEASIFVEREFAKQQQQRILQMEKLLLKTPPLPQESTKSGGVKENVTTA